MNEEWKDIKGYEGLYQVSNLGRVKSYDKEVIQKHYSGCDTKHIYKGRIMKLRKNKNGYMLAYLTINKKQTKYLVHRLVASAFLHKDFGKNYVNHLDGNPTNNNVNNSSVGQRALHHIVHSINKKRKNNKNKTIKQHRHYYKKQRRKYLPQYEFSFDP